MQDPPFENYDREWEKVDSLTAIGQYASAKDLVSGIYEQASTDENAPQMAKAVTYLAGFTATLEEGGSEKALLLLEDEIAKATGQLRAVLQSMTASYYQQYLSNSYWQIRERTETAGPPGDDRATWSVGQLESRIAELFLASVDDPDLLAVPATTYATLTNELNAKKDYRPQLYDLLVHRALDYFSASSSYLNEPAYKFYIDQEEAFSTASEFANFKFESRDTTSFARRALFLFQDVLAHHADEPALLLDADIRRMQFVYSKSVHPEKDMLFEAALDQMLEAYPGQDGLAEVQFLRAQLLYSQGAKWQRGMEDEELRLKWRASWQLCKEIIDRYPNTYGAGRAAGLLVQLEAKQLQAQIEQVNLPDEDILLQLQFRNVPKAHFRIIPLTNDIEQKLEDNRRQDFEKRWRYLRGLQDLRSWSLTLPQPNDFREHVTEVGLESLPSGRYILLLSSDADFRNVEFGGYTIFQTSSLTVTRRTSLANGAEVLVVDRGTGAPVESARVEVLKGRWNSVSRRIVWNEVFSGTTNSNGFLSYPTEEDANYKFIIRKDDQSLYSGSFYSGRFYYREPQTTQVTHFFLDRSIYRPGQTIYFKALLTEQDGAGKPRILPNQPVKITFKDVNYQTVRELNLRSNEFGTVEGSFVAPTDRLLGQMHLSSSIGGNGSYFRVEEYKRPKFEVSFHPVEGEFKLNETISLQGEAKAFAGNALDEVDVAYRVVREVRFPRWAWYWWRYYPSAGTEIARGNVMTNASGVFDIEFEAMPDRAVPGDQQPTFSYTVYATVVDGTGETHSASTVVNVGYVGLQADIRLGAVIPRDSFQVVPFEVRNLNGQPVAASGSLSLEYLRPPQEVFRNRYWESADLPILSESEFHNRFPEYAFGNSDDPASWEVDRVIWTQQFNTESGSELPVGKVKLPVGTYRLQLVSQDRSGAEVKDVHIFQVFEENRTACPGSEVGWHFFGQAGQLEPGMQAQVYVGSPAGKAYYLFERVRAGQSLERRWIEVKGVQAIDQLIEEEDRGALKWNLMTYGHNRSSFTSVNPAIPWSNKELQISFRSFRDKMLPGSEERWEMVIQGPQGAEAAAEMVAAMYDASLDQIVDHGWSGPSWPTYFSDQFRWDITGYGAQGITWLYTSRVPYPSSPTKEYRYFNPFSPVGFRSYGNYYMLDGVATGGAVPRRREADRAAPELEEISVMSAEPAEKMNADVDAVVVEGAPPPPPPPPGPEEVGPPVQIRTNLDETVFFLPELRTDTDGNIVLSFTMNEALTKWKFLSFAHTKDLKVGQYSTTVQTQKPLMVQPNPPRFYRERDQIEFTAKVVNLTEETLSGNVHLELVNSLTGDAVFEWRDNPEFQRSFTLEAGRSESVSWRFTVPDINEVPLLEHTVVAVTEAHSDAERDAVPVLSNRELVTESLPLPVRGGQTKTFKFQHLASYQSSTLDHTGFTLEFTSNPAWYAVQALPYLMEYPHECSEQIFSRYYANSLAAAVANSTPQIQEVFESWKGTEAMQSPLSRNEELKSALLAETPWVLQAQSEEAQRRDIALLFDMQRMAREQASALVKLQQRQLPGGGFAWFPGGRDNWYITQYIVEGMGHLDRLGVKELRDDPAAWNMIVGAVSYIDDRFLEHYENLERLVRRGEASWDDDHLSYMALHYLYARSFFLEDRSARASAQDLPDEPDREYLPLTGKVQTAFDYYLGQAEKFWTVRSHYAKGLIALSLHRMGHGEVPALIVKALDEQAIRNEELGAYWNYQSGYYWYQNSTETHTLMIELFDEVANDAEMVELLRIWLLKNKQTNHWKTTKATAGAVYALLMNGDNWLAETGQVEVRLGRTENLDWQAQIAAAQEDAEAGTGYFKTRFDGTQVDREMAFVEVTNPNKVVAWGAVYWQYMEDLDKIERFEETPLQIVKQVYRVDLTDRGEQLVALEDGAVLEPGDKLHVRIELRVDRSMEYVHMKDMRASGFEPIETLSSYKWQDGLGYYESPRDLATDFFISYLPKGTYVFEYPLRVVHRGDFSNGITTVQCMYAPEFTSHSEGIRIRVE